MSRRKKSSHGRRARPRPPERQEHPPTTRLAQGSNPSPPRSAPEPNPPGPNKRFLLATGILLTAWIAVLIFLAVTT